MSTLLSVWPTLTNALAQFSARPSTTALAVNQSSRYMYLHINNFMTSYVYSIIAFKEQWLTRISWIR